MKFSAMFFVLSLFVTHLVYAGIPININTANVEEIAQSLDGIGLKKAEAIVEHREREGAFQSLDELSNVKGIGIKTLERNRSNLIFQETQENATD